MPDLRTERRAHTERSIIDAVHRMLADEHPASLSMPQVADAAGVSLRTLYRYFPTKADLVDAASRSFEIEVGTNLEAPNGIADVEPFLVAMWRAFDASLPAVMAQHATPAGRELRQRRLTRSREHLRGVLALVGPGLDDSTAEQLVDTVILLTGSAMYLELTQHLGHSSPEAAHMMSVAVRAVITDAIGATA